VTAQRVKTLGRRNAKPTANREVVEEYIQHHRTPPTENEAGKIPGMEMRRK
jgi:Fe2+ or Zn2+ uptake regulation protein